MRRPKRVFVVQTVMKRGASSPDLVRKFDLTPAKEHGEFVYVLSPSASPFSPASLMREMSSKLQDITPDDSLLLIGSPVLIGMTVAIASRHCSRLHALQWNGLRRCYARVEMDFSVVDANRDSDWWKTWSET